MHVANTDWNALFQFLYSCIVFLLLVGLKAGQAQTDLAIQSGFGDGLISKFAFDDSGRYLAAVVQKSNSRTVTLWEVSTRTLIKTYRVNVPQNEVLSLPTRIGFVESPTRIQVESPFSLETWEINTDRYQRIALFPQEYAKGMQRSEVAKWSASGKYLVSASAMAQSGLISITEVETGKHEMIDVDFPPATIAISDDDSFIATSINQKVAIYDRESKKELKSFDANCVRITDLRIFRKDDRIVVDGRQAGTAITLVHSINTGEEIYSFSDLRAPAPPLVLPTDNEVIWTKRDPRGNHILTSPLGDPSDSKAWKSIDDPMLEMAYSRQNEILAIATTELGYASKINLYDYRSGQPLGTLDTDIEYGRTVYNPDTKRLYQACYSGLYEWDFTTGRRNQIHDKPIGGGLAFSSADDLFFLQNKQFARVSTRPDQSKSPRLFANYNQNESVGATYSDNRRFLASLNRDQSVDFIDLQNDQNLYRIVRSSNADTKVGSIANMVPSNDGKSICIVDTLGNLEVWDVPQRRRIYARNHRQFKSAKTPNRSAVLSTKAIGNNFILAGEMGVWRLEGQNTLTQIDDPPIVSTVSISPGGKYLFAPRSASRSSILDLETGEETARLDLELAQYASIECIDELRLIAIRHSGISEIWSMANGKQLATLLPIKENGFALVTPDGFVKSNQAGLDAVAFRDGLLVTRFDKWCENRLRPDLVMQSIGLSDTDYLDQLKSSVQWKLGQTDTNAPLNAITRLELTEQLPSHTTKSEIEVSIPNSQMKSLTEFTVDVNGVREQVKHGSQNEFPVRLLPGRNRIVMAGRSESGDRSILVHDIFSKQPVQKSKTWFVGLGVSKYQKESMNLDFASKDVADLADELQFLAGGRFQRLLLRDEQATKQEVLKSVAAFVQQASPQDSLILVLAGHGFVNSTSYQFALHDCEFDSADAGTLGLSEIERLVSKSPARRRVVMLDTCHSGSELPGTNSTASQGSVKFKARSSLGVSSSTTTSRQDQIRKHMLEQFGNQVGMSGTTVISASNAGQFALESADWNNGAFTFAVRKAIRSKSADFDSDGIIGASELAKYVEEFVAELTGGKQRPEARFLNSALDTSVVEAKEINQLTLRFNAPDKDGLSPNCLAVCPMGKYLAMAVKNRIQVMNLETGKIKEWRSESTESIHKLVFTKDSECLIAWQYQGQIWATALKSEELKKLKAAGGNSSQFVLSADKSVAVILNSFAKQFTRFNFSDQGVESRTIDIDEIKTVSSHTILPNNTTMRALVGGVVKDFDLDSGESKVFGEVEMGDSRFGDQISFFDSGKLLVKTGLQEETSGFDLSWSNVATGEVKKSKSRRPLFGVHVNGKTMPLRRLGEFPGRTPARYRFLFDTDAQASVNERSLDINENETFRLSNDERLVAVSRKSTAYDSPNRGIRIYSLVTGKEIAWLKPPDDEHFELGFGKDNRKLYAIDSDWRVWFWDLNVP